MTYDGGQISGTQDRTTNLTIVEVSRQLNTLDTAEDRAILPGTIRIAAAYGVGSIFHYHQSQRTTAAIKFYGEDQPEPDQPDLQTAEFTFPPYRVPAQQTTYACYSFPMPIPPKDPKTGAQYKAHIVGFEGVIRQHLELPVPIVHHMVVHQCTSDKEGYYPQFRTPHECVSPAGFFLSKCSTVIYAWAIGMGGLTLPDQTGFLLADNDIGGIQWGLIEIHYNNPLGAANVVDTSGFKMKYTTTLRRYDAGVITMGDPFTFGRTLPANSVQLYSYECPSNCTRQMLNKVGGSATVFATFQHMHNAGKQFYTHHLRPVQTGDSPVIEMVDLGVTSKIE